MLQNFEKLSLVESFFNIKRDCGIQSRTLPNAKLHHRWFNKGLLKKLHRKLWKIIRKKYVVKFSFIRVARLQNRYILRVLRKGKGVLKFWKFQKNRKYAFLTLQPCSAEFLTSANVCSKKNVSFEYSEMVGSLPDIGLYWIHLIN